MSLFKQFATNRQAEVEGIEVTFGGANEDGSMPTFRIARMHRNNKRYQKMVEQETKPHIFAIRNDTLDPAIDEAITMRVFIATILLGWKDLIVPEVFDTHERVEYTPENAEKLFKALPELYTSLRENAQKMSLFRESEIAADSKI
jgi:hypothetical protein